jgi:hypothetical protein
MQSACRIPLIALGLVGLFTSLSNAQDMLRWVPADSNAVAHVRVSELLNSPFGRQRKWLTEYREAYAAGLLAAPPTVQEFIRATEYRPHARDEEPIYTIFSMRGDVSMNDIAQHELSRAERIADTFAVHSQRGAYFARLGNRLLGSLEPADRQLLARWLRSAAPEGKNNLSDYIREVLASEKDGQVVLAIDLTDMADAEYLAKWLALSPAVKAQKVEIEALAEQFASLHGVRLVVTVNDDIVARLMKDIVGEWIDNSGAHVESIATADAKVDGKTFTLSSQMSEQGFRRVLSLIQTQHPNEPATDPQQAQQANVVASKRYYDAVVAAVRDLEFQNRRATDYEKTALWHENHAARIENLSTIGVDPELVAWGYNLSQQLRALANSLRGVPIEVDRLNRAIRVDVRTYNRRIATTEFGGIFRPEWFTTQSNLQDVRAAQQEAIIQDREDRAAIWRMLEEDRQAIVAKMKEKYGVDFEAK